MRWKEKQINKTLTFSFNILVSKHCMMAFKYLFDKDSSPEYKFI